MQGRVRVYDNWHYKEVKGGLAMKLNEFVAKFADELEDMDPAEVTAETEFKTLGAWDSLTVLSIISMIKLDYDVSISGLDVNNCDTIADVYALIEKANG